MSVQGLLESLRTRGVELWFEANRLRFRSPRGALSQQDREALVAQRDEVLATLRAQASTHVQLVPLSFSQRALWILHQQAPSSAAYHVSFSARILSEVDLSVVEQTAQALVDRHAILRTTYDEVDGEPMQRIAGNVRAGVEVFDASGLSDEALRASVEADYRRPFDLQRGPVHRISLHRRGPSSYVLLITVHHIAADGWSLFTLLEEFRQFHEEFRGGRPAKLSRPTTQYTDYSAWQAQLVNGEEGDRLLAYWLKKLAPPREVVDLPTDRPRPAAQTFRGNTVAFTLDAELSDRLKAVARAEGATLFALLLASFKALLHRYTASEDIVVGTPTFGRNKTEFVSVVGDFVNTVPLRDTVTAGMPFRTLLANARQTVIDALNGQEMPLPLLVERLRPERDASRSPLFDTFFVFQRFDQFREMEDFLLAGSSDVSIDFGGLRFAPYPFDQQEGQFDLAVQMAERAGRLAGGFKYSTDLFDETTIQRMVGHFRALLEGIARDPGVAIGDLPLLTSEETHQLRDLANATAVEYPTTQVFSRLFESVAAEHASSVAVTCGDRALTYAELNARANRLARCLRARGVRPGTLAGVCLHRSNEMLVALLAIQKAGGAYVPLDPGFPAERLGFMLADSKATVLVIVGGASAIEVPPDTAVFDLNAEAAAIASASAENLADCASPRDPVYVIYTSGSTGRPKGVVVPNGALVNFLCSMRREPGIGATDVLAAITTLSFDIAGLELYLPLLVGARIDLLSRDVAADGIALAARLQESGATILQATPATWRLLLDAGWQGSPRLRALCGGEAMPRDLAERLLGRVRELWNLYGPTETTIWSSLERVQAGTGLVSIGRPIANTQIHIVDNRGRLAPVGVPGEIWIGGHGVAIGYHERAELTAERFVQDPFRNDGSRLYRTGDRGRRLADGRLEHLGRFDHQVKLRGFRIELGEIESVLAEHASVDAAVAIVREDRPGDQRLVAYVVGPATSEGSQEDLQRALAARLPSYMIPSVITRLERLPLTPNGKVDRKALPAPDLGANADEYEPPATPVENTLAALWSDLLGVPQVSRNANFFTLGGHSLLAMRMVARMRRELQIELPLQAVFEAPTLAQVAALIERTKRGVSSVELSVPQARADRSVPAPATFVQRRMWFFDQVSPGGTLYNIPIVFEVSGPVDATRFQRALDLLFDRHEALRTCLEQVDGEIVQRVVPDAQAELRTQDLSSVAPERRARALHEQLAREARHVFDLSHGPLARLLLLRLTDQEHRLIMTVHHAVFDGSSINIFLRELAELYAALGQDRVPRLTPLPYQYSDFGAWQRAAVTEELLAPQLAYWREQLAGAPELLELLPDRVGRSTASTFESSVCELVLPPGLSASIRELARKENATAFMVMLAAFQTLLYRYTGEDDIVVGSPIAGRNQPGTDELIGVFINTLVLRTDLSGDPTFRELIARVRGVALGAYAHQDVPFERLVEELKPVRHLGRSPLVQVLFNLLNYSANFHLPAHDIELRLRPTLDLAPSEEQLTLYAFDDSQGMHLWLVYSRDRLEAATAQRFLEHFRNLLEGAIADPERRISVLPLLATSERQRLLSELNSTECDFPRGQCYASYFEEQVRRTPNAIALRDGESTLSFAELNARANRVAHVLVAAGVGPTKPVALLAERSALWATWTLAIFKAGGAYLPLDPQYPSKRHVDILRQSGASIALASPAHERRLAETVQELPADERPRVLTADELQRESTDASDLAPRGTPDDLAYIIFTSGSTGTPKGAMVPHRSMLNHFWSKIRGLGLTTSDVVVQSAPSGFDISVWQLLAAFLAGGSVRIAPDAVTHDPERLFDLVRAENLTVLEIVPSVLRAYLDSAPLSVGGSTSNALALRWLVMGGEALPADLCRRWFQRWPGTPMINGYGPSECADDATRHIIEAPPPETAASVPIGRAIDNVRVYVVDRLLNPLPVGVPGELCIGGAGVGLGYVNDPERTNAAFVPDPFSSAPGAKLYRTGDRVRLRADGELEFVGRIDHQVKIRGHRIELGEIEALTARCPGVRQVVVNVYRTASGDRLAAYIVPTQESSPPTVEELRSRLQAVLPGYMVPDAFVLMTALPLNANGKINRRALPEPAPVAAAEFVAPRTAAEKQVARIWAEVLKIEQVGVDDNFFELGGHSLLATQVVSRLRVELGLDISVRLLFEQQTLGALAAHLGTCLDARDGASATPVESEAREELSL